MAVPAAPDAAGALTEGTAGHGRGRRLLLVVLVALLLVATGVLAWLALDRTGEAEEVQDERDAVMAATQEFMQRFGSYGPELLAEDGTMPDYREQVTEVITPKFATSFEEQVTAAEQIVAQSGVTRSVDVFSTGVAVLDDDSATALAAGTFTDDYGQAAAGEGAEGQAAVQPFPFRLEVSLVKIDGEWLVDNFTPVTGAAGSEQAPGPAGGSATPGATPEGTPTPEEEER